MAGKKEKGKVSIAERDEQSKLLQTQVRQQQVVTDLGLLALRGTDLRVVMNEAVQKLKEVLNVEYTKVLELLPNGEEVILRAGLGWHEDIVIDKSTVDTGANSQAGYTLLSSEPVIVKDLRTEKRFSGPQLLTDHHVVSGMSCVIWGRNNKPYGVLGIHTTTRRDFTFNEVNFLQSVANTLAAAIQRKQDEDKLQESEGRKSAILESSRDAIITIDFSGRVIDWNTAAEKIFGYSREHVCGKNMATLIVPHRHREAHQAGMTKYLATGEGPVLGKLLEMPALRADGSEFLAELTITRTLLGGPPIFSATMRDITERKKSEQALRESEARFRATFDEAAIAMAITDLKGKWLSFNQVYLKMFGYTLNELKQLDFTKITHPDDRASDKEAIEKLVRCEIDSMKMEKRYFHKDGSLIWGVAHLSTIKDAEGKPQNIIAAIQNITIRKQAEEALRRSEEKFRMLADNIPNLCWMADVNGAIYWYNSRWYEYTGSTPIEMQREGWKHLHDPEILPYVLIRWNASISSGEPFEMVFPLRGADKIYRPFLTRVVPVKNEQGQILHWFGTNTDITELREAENKLQYQKSLLEAQQEASPLGILVVSPEGKVVNYNERFTRMWHLPENFDENDINEIILEDSRDQLSNPEVFIGKVADCYNTRIQNHEKLHFKDGRIYDRYGSPITGEDGTYYGYVWFYLDITEQENLARQKDEFVGIASHELKTPLTSIKGSIQIIDRLFKDGSYDKIDNFLSKAHLHVDKLVVLINDLLDVSKIQAGKLQYNFSEFVVREIIEDSVEQVAHQSKEHKVIINGELTISVYGDKGRLEQVVSNLITNAVKYSPGKTEVIVNVSNCDGCLLVSVTDFGIGIPKENLPSVFDRFFRVEQNVYQFQGLGLGLYISREIISRHGGVIWAESEGKDRGATFNFKIPLKEIKK